MDTAMRDAFAKAGVKPAEEKLKDIALTAMVAHADDTMAAIEQVWAAVKGKPDLLIALFDRYDQHTTEIGRLFNQIKRDIAAQASGKENLGPRERKAMTIITREREKERREQEEQRAADRAEQARSDREYKEYLASWHKTPISDVRVGDKPVWEVSAGTVRAWLPTQHRKLRAIEMLIEGIPEDGRAIGYYRTPDDLMEIWKILGQQR